MRNRGFEMLAFDGLRGSYPYGPPVNHPKLLNRSFGDISGDRSDVKYGIVIGGIFVAIAFGIFWATINLNKKDGNMHGSKKSKKPKIKKNPLIVRSEYHKPTRAFDDRKAYKRSKDKNNWKKEYYG